jgi:hypothetical protein
LTLHGSESNRASARDHLEQSMKRDLDLRREVLLSAEAFQPTVIGELQRVSPKDFSGSEPQNMHHIELPIGAGF